MALKRPRAAAKARHVDPVNAMAFLAVLYMIMVTQVPFAVTVYESLFSQNLLMPYLGTHFVGLGNYVSAFQSGGFINALLNTVYLVAFTVVGAVLCGLGLALLIHRKFALRGVCRTLLMTPFLLMSVITAVIWKDVLLDPLYGFVNYILRLLGQPRVDFIATAPMAVIIIMGIWQWMPFSMLILSAGLDGQNPSVLEAASMDGASGVALMRHITWPHLRPYLLVCVLLSLVLVIPTFGKIFVTTSGGPGQLTTDLAYAVFHQAFQVYDTGTAAAYAILSSVITMSLAITLVSVVVRQRRERIS